MWWIVVASLFSADPAPRLATDDLPPGALVLVGGGGTTAEIRKKTLELAGGKRAKVAILAAANPEYGQDSLELWQAERPAQVKLIDLHKPEGAKRILNEADLIWFPGGLQGVFMNGLRGTGIEEVVRRRHRAGVTIAGTSAGAAVMSKMMIGGRSDLDSLKAGTAPYLMDGLGLWPTVIIDQHFLQKGRFNRLALATIDHPHLVGIGIDEETAVIVKGSAFEVIGNNNVTVIDAREASREVLTKGDAVAARNLKVHVLRAGMTFDLEESTDSEE